MQDFSEEAIRHNCPHCDIKSHAFEYMLDETDLFYIVCDAHSLIEGHILIIPKAHRSCIGEFTPEEFAEFELLSKKVSDFVQSNYGPVALFEHGKFGQTVFHSHIHFLPFEGSAEDIIPEGAEHLRPLANLKDIYDIFTKEGGYLLFGIEGQLWTVDPELAAPRFFRDRFANVLGGPERGNWKTARQDPHLMHQMSQDNHSVQKLWQKS